MMNSTYQNALNGTLFSDPSTTAADVMIYNDLPFSIIMYTTNTSGQRENQGNVATTANAELTNLFTGDYMIFTSALTGSFISAIEISSASVTYHVNESVLCEPNDIGTYAAPTLSRMVPVNSPLVLIGAGTVTGTVLGSDNTPQTNFVTREQYWNLAGDSYSVSPGESRTVSSTLVSGRQATSSLETTFAASVGYSATASGGGSESAIVESAWASASASVSASLNLSASAFLQVSLNEQSTSYISDTITNESDDTMLVLRWQMMDVITVYNPTGQPISSVVSGLNPIIAAPIPLGSIGSDVVRPELIERSNPVTVKINEPETINET